MRAAAQPRFPGSASFRFHSLKRIMFAYPGRLPHIILDKRTIDSANAKPASRRVDCSLGEVHLSSHYDLYQLKEIMVWNMYAENDYIPRPGWTVVDVGANLGFFTLWCASLMKKGVIIAIEAVPATHAILVQNLRNVQRLNIRVSSINVAVCDEKRDVEMLMSPLDSGTSTASDSTIAVNLAEIGEIEKMTVPGDTLDSIVSEHGLIAHTETIELLKIDVEGFETKCLSAASAVLARTKRVVFEYHSSELKRSCADILLAAGFRETPTGQQPWGLESGLSFWSKPRTR